MPTNVYHHRLRTQDAALHLGLSKSTLEKLRLAGGGPRYAKLGKICVYALDDLEAWAQARLRNSTSEPTRICPHKSAGDAPKSMVDSPVGVDR